MLVKHRKNSYFLHLFPIFVIPVSEIYWSKEKK